MLKRLLVTAAALVAVVGVVKSAGLFWGYPIVGGSSYCVTYQNQQTNSLGVVTSQGTCVATAPAGPTTATGNELLIADTQLPGTQQPQTVYMPVSVMAGLGQGSSRNVLMGSDFATNLWQRGTTFTSLTPTTTTMTADRWGVYSSGNTVTVTKDVTAADVLATAGVNGIMKVTRPSGTNTTSICVGQVLPQAESARFIGNEAVFSFYAEALAGYLQTNSTIIPTIAVYTAADSSTPGTNTDAFFKATITGYTVLNSANAVSVINSPTTSSTTAPSVLPLTTSLVRYSVAAYVPSTVLVSSVATAVTGIGVTLCTGAYPASTGVATDGFAFGNPQLEATSPGTSVGGVLVAAPNTAPGSYARPWVAWDQLSQLSYSWVISEPAASVSVGPSGQGASTTTCVLSIPIPVWMREVGTNTISTISGSTWTVTHVVTNTALSSMATTTGGNTRNMVNVTATVASGLTAGQTCTLTGAGGGATITVSAEP